MADLFTAGHQVKVSAAMARLPFTECGPLCISTNGCGGNCCDAPSRPSGCMVTVHPNEERRLAAFGGVVLDGLLQPAPGARGCPFKSEGLCGLHAAGMKPFGCVASPFTLNGVGTLIVRNRYKLLPCYRGPGPKAPAYHVFYSSLVLIFGPAEALRLARHFDGGGGDIAAEMPALSYEILTENDAIKRRAKGGVPAHV